ncbi:PP2C family protein-serine/threonine phosphatase [Thermodesulfobacteriota bacterium]
MNEKTADGNDSINLNLENDSVVVAGISDKGCVREKNEDNICVHESGEILLLADGMGGHERGAEASRIAIDTFSVQLTPELIKSQMTEVTAAAGIPTQYASIHTIISRAVGKTANTLSERNAELSLERYMGTTIVGLVIVDEEVFWFHVGDSRVYRFKDSKLEQLTSDHSAYEDWKKAGSVGTAPGKNLITKAIGINPLVEADIEYDEKRSGDIYLLCSDGLSDMIFDEKIEEILSGENDIPEKTNLLFNAALSAGGKDNISVILCKMV